MLIIDKEIQEKMDKIEPYEVKGVIPDDAPDWVKKTQKEIEDWFHEGMDGVM